MAIRSARSQRRARQMFEERVIEQLSEISQELERLKNAIYEADSKIVALEIATGSSNFTLSADVPSDATAASGVGSEDSLEEIAIELAYGKSGIPPLSHIIPTVSRMIPKGMIRHDHPAAVCWQYPEDYIVGDDRICRKRWH